MKKTTYIKDAIISVRLEGRHKHALARQAVERGKTLGEYVLEILLSLVSPEARRK